MEPKIVLRAIDLRVYVYFYIQNKTTWTRLRDKKSNSILCHRNALKCYFFIYNVYYTNKSDYVPLKSILAINI
jgi:hypothetical protein